MKKVFVVVLFVLVLAVAAWLGMRYAENRLRIEMVRTIEQRFDSKAQLESLEIQIFPQLHATGTKLVLWHKGRKDLPPLISVDEFTADTLFFQLTKKPIHINQLTLKGLVIQVPPKGSTGEDQTQTQNQTQTQTQSADKAQDERIPKDDAISKAERSIFIVDHVVADGTFLRVLPKKPGADPLEFELYKLNLREVGLNDPMEYESILKNAKPPGMIHAKGTFGPWATEDPGATPLTGKYTFQDADLGIFKGISGKLSSVGEFKGILREIEANGTTDTPDFMVETGKHPVHLTTEYHAIIDGTNGDTLLKPVTAHFGKTDIVCNGGVTKEEGMKGKSVILDVTVTRGRMEDLMTLVVPGKTPLVGSIRFTAKMKLPPGDIDVVKKLRLKGNFGVGNAEFTSDTVQQKIETLSMRSRGIHDEDTDERIASDLKGDFALADSNASFTKLSFVVPGAKVQLAGDYGLLSQKIDFEGTLTMDAKISQTQTGIKSLLLKLVDPFFKKGTKGAVIPIKIQGTRSKPEIGLKLGGGSKDK